MRILVVGINYAPDLIGVAKYNTELCEALASCGTLRSLAVDRTLCRKLGDGARAIALARWDKATILSTLEQVLASSDQRAGAQASPRLPKISGTQRAAP